MTYAQRLAWRNGGAPFRLARPLARLRDKLRAYGYTVYDIGNTEHLDAGVPEDHTPYSATGWPVSSPYGVGFAVDVMPPHAGLPSLQQLGARIVADRNAGVPGISWLKYMNWEPERNNGGACWQDSWQPNYSRRNSSDRGHIHISGRSDMADSAIGDDYDPVARIRGTQEDDMGLETSEHAEIVQGNLTPLNVLHWRIRGTQDQNDPELAKTRFGRPTTPGLKQLGEQLTALTGKVDGLETPAVDTLALGQYLESSETFVRNVTAGLAGAVVDELARRLNVG